MVSKVQRVGLVFYEPNWNGGRWYVAGKQDYYPLSEFKTFKDKLKVVIRDELFDAEIKDISGVDHDMGHEYSWTNITLNAIANINGLDKVGVNLEDKCKNKDIKVYLEIHDK